MQTVNSSVGVQTVAIVHNETKYQIIKLIFTEGRVHVWTVRSPNDVIARDMQPFNYFNKIVSSYKRRTGFNACGQFKCIQIVCTYRYDDPYEPSNHMY